MTAALEFAQPANIVPMDSLLADGWRPFQIRWLYETHDHPLYGKMRNFDVIGEVPQSAGQYLFALDLDDLVEVRYTGKTALLTLV